MYYKITILSHSNAFLYGGLGRHIGRNWVFAESFSCACNVLANGQYELRAIIFPTTPPSAFPKWKCRWSLYEKQTHSHYADYSADDFEDGDFLMKQDG